MQLLKTQLLKGAFNFVEELDSIVEEAFGSVDEFELIVEDVEKKIFLELYFETVEVDESFTHEFGTEHLYSSEINLIRVENVYYYNEDHSTEELELSEVETVLLSQIILNK